MRTSRRSRPGGALRWGCGGALSGRNGRQLARLQWQNHRDRSASRTSIESEPGGNLGLEQRPPDAGAYVIYTSGSTGKPKGVLIEQHAIALHCVDSQSLYGLGPQDKVLQFNSLSFDAAFEQIRLRSLAGHPCPARARNWTARPLGQQIEVCELTVIDLPTAYWRQVLVEWSEILHCSRCTSRGFSSWEARPCLPRRCGSGASCPFHQARLINAYGPTETTITATAFELTRSTLRGELPKRVPIGRPRGARAAYILDEMGGPHRWAFPESCTLAVPCWPGDM